MAAMMGGDLSALLGAGGGANMLAMLGGQGAAAQGTYSSY